MSEALHLPYGTGSLPLPAEVGREAAVVKPGPFPPGDGKGLVTDALVNTVGSADLDSLPLETGRIACIIPDLTRRSAVSTYLPELLEKALARGLDPERLHIIVALGIHRPMTGNELREHVGEWVWERFRITNHDCDSDDDLVMLGSTRRGIPVRVNRMVAEADALLVTGSVTYHYFAGYGGGRKSILPGVSARETCEAHHKLVVGWRQGRIGGLMGPGILKGNPVEEEMSQAAQMTPPAFCLNVVTSPDNRIIGAAAGSLKEAHQAACKMHDSYFSREVQGRSKLVIASAGGWPRDINFIQSHKGHLSAVRAALPGGVVILAARCEDGAGNPDFLSWFERCSEDSQWLKELDDNYQINGQTAYSTWLRTRKIKAILVSEMTPGDVRTMGMIPAGSLEEAVALAREELGELPPAVVLPNAADTLVRLLPAEGPGG
jgi:nickel-dependent lactate racemase